ncbi:MAG: TlpA family protein disulfide reductase [Treponema sp.]|jgi:thiol-disulfide isomerase/thioredoxin|nr:TlpA family protein disulfide reductase [Treponema sp.]
MKKTKKMIFWMILMCLFIPMMGGAQTVSQDVANAFRRARIPVRKPVPIRDFTARMLDGSTQKLSGLKGNVVFLNFWATWCGPCRTEMPSMENLYQQFKNRPFVMLAIDLQEDQGDVSSFMRQMGLTFPVGIDDGPISDMYGISAIPTTFIIDRNGYIIATIAGSRNWNTQDVFSAIDALLND